MQLRRKAMWIGLAMIGALLFFILSVTTGRSANTDTPQEALGYMFSEPDLDTMQLVRCAFDPANISNPNKVFPRTRLCGDVPGPYKPHPLETAGIAEIF